MAKKNKALISIVGRPNVGKSTLVNRLAGRRICIVDDVPGVTRDRKYIDIDWDGFSFTAVDTGGLMFNENEVFSQEIMDQTFKGLENSDAVIFVVDALAGVTKLDAQVADFLRKNTKAPVYIAANKVDNTQRRELIYAFYELGFEDVFPISALHGSVGLGDLLTTITNSLKEKYQNEIDEDEEIKVAIIGKPNVGKSSLFNKLIGEGRSIVSDLSGTTRDSIDTILHRHDQSFRLIDTAGLRRKAKVQADIERHSNLRAVNSIEDCDVAVLLVDASAEVPGQTQADLAYGLNAHSLKAKIEEQGDLAVLEEEEETKLMLGEISTVVTEQDKKIAGLITDRGKACIILVNKWDLFADKGDKDALRKYKERLAYELRFLSWAPMDFISALTGQRTDKIWETIIGVSQEHRKKISTNFLNKMIGEITTLNPPPLVKQKSIKIKYVSQVGVCPPTFAFFVNEPNLVPETYKRFLERQLREYFGFEGTPLFLKFKRS